jgi:hypothetical protein
VGREAVLSALGLRRASPWNPWSALVSPANFTTLAMAQLVEAMTRRTVGRVVVISAAGVGHSMHRGRLDA